VLGRREGVLPSGSAYVVQFMVINALGPALIALLLAVLMRFELSEVALARIGSAVYFATAPAFVALSIHRERALSSAGELVLPRWIGRTLWTGAIVAHAIQLANLVGFPMEPSIGVLLLGLWVLLGMASMQFVSLLFIAFR
jgi:hypothetical protein